MASAWYAEYLEDKHSTGDIVGGLEEFDDAADGLFGAEDLSDWETQTDDNMSDTDGTEKKDKLDHDDSTDVNADVEDTSIDVNILHTPDFEGAAEPEDLEDFSDIFADDDADLAELFANELAAADVDEDTADTAIVEEAITDLMRDGLNLDEETDIDVNDSELQKQVMLGLKPLSKQGGRSVHFDNDEPLEPSETSPSESPTSPTTASTVDDDLRQLFNGYYPNEGDDYQNAQRLDELSHRAV